METELEKVNWVLVKHYVWQAKIVMAAMQAAHSEEARCSFLRTATNYMEHCVQQFEHVMTGRSLNNGRKQ